MLVSIQISTGRVIEMQSHATAGTLVTNAVNSGYLPEDVLEIKTENYKVGNVWNGSAFVESLTEQVKSVRQQRDDKLKECDWTQAADSPVDKAAWAVYRQALRDLPAQAGFPNQIIWPTKPE